MRRRGQTATWATALGLSVASVFFGHGLRDWGDFAEDVVVILMCLATLRRMRLA